ncbi:hypothetical protein [Mucilaginibacter sp.]|nr:hypothetical protein [Mucilaginibacter sp.]
MKELCEAVLLDVYNIQETIGKWIIKGKSLMADFLSPFLSVIEELTTTKFSETLEHERVEMNMLGLQIQDTNVKGDERVKLIQKFIALAPEHLKNLNAEKSTNQEIAAAVERLNDLYINRIILAKKDEEIESQNEKTADLRMKKIEAERNMREEIVKLHQKFPEFKMVDGTTADKLGGLLKQYHDMIEAGHGTSGGIFSADFSANHALSEFRALQEFEAGMMKKGDAMVKARADLIKELGIDETFKPKDGEKPPVTPPQGGPTAKESDAEAKKLEAQKKALEEYQNQLRDTHSQIDDLIAGATKGTLEGLDAQLKVIDDKYQKLIAKLRELNGNKNATPADKAANNKQISDLQTSDTAAQLVATSDADFKNDMQILQSRAAEKQRVLEQQRADDLISQEGYERRKSELDQSSYADEYYLAVYYGQNTVSIEKKLADAEIANKKRAHDQGLKFIKSEVEAQQDALKARQGIEGAKAGLMQSGFALVNSIFGKNKALMLAELALEKIIAIGKIKASEGVEIAGYFAKYALVPGGEFIAAGLAAAADARANLSIISIIASGVAEAVTDLAAGSSGSVPKHADGGFTGLATSDNPAGYVNVPTLFNKKYIAGEAGSEWIAPNWMLKNPYTANVMGALEALRQQGSASVPAHAAGGFTGSAQPANMPVFDLGPVVDKLAAIEQKIQDQQVVIDYHYLKREDAKYVQLQNKSKA